MSKEAGMKHTLQLLFTLLTNQTFKYFLIEERNIIHDGHSQAWFLQHLLLQCFSFTDSDAHLINMNSGPQCNIQKALWRTKETLCCKICICVVIRYKKGIKKTLC